MTVPQQDNRVTQRVLVAFAIRVASAAVAYVSHILLARWLNLEQYGLFAAVWTWLLIVGGTLPLGFNVAVIGRLPRRLGEGDAAGARGLVATAFGLTLALSVLVAMVAVALVAWRPDLAGGVLAPLAVLAILCLPLLALAELNEGVARALGWMGAALVPAYIARPLTMLLTGGALHVSGYELDAAAILACALFATAAMALVQTVWIMTGLMRIIGWGPLRLDARTWLLVALPKLVTEVCELLLASLDLLLVAAWVGSAEAGLYFAAQRSIALVGFVNFAVGAATASVVAAALADRTRLRQEVRRAATLAFWPTLAGALVIVMAGPHLLGLFGPRFTQAAPIMAILAVGLVARSFVGPAELLLNVVGAGRACAVILTVHLGLALVLNAVLVPAFGITGAAVAASSTMVSLAIGFATYAWFRHGLVMMPSSPLPEIARLARLAG
jgi:O-antigen/teichoic acid export membrane protein